MTRNLKALLAAAMALAVFGALSVSGARAAEFHCDPAAGTGSCKFTLKPDGTGTTAHHVIVVKNAAGETLAFTCSQLDGSGTAAQTASSVTITKLNYTTCKVFGVTTTVRLNSCDYNFAAAGTMTIAGCGAEKSIEIEGGGGGAPCIVTIGNQGPLAGIKYHNLGTTAGGNTEITMEIKVTGIAVTVDNPVPGCFGLNSPPYTAEYTTGNTIITAETDVESPVMTAGWWL